MAEVAVYDNASLDLITLRNLTGAAIDHKTVVWFDKANPGGFCKGDNANAGGVAGVVEEKGFDTTNGVPLTTVPNGQVSAVRFAGITKIRAGAVAITAGEKVYAVPATGKVTNVATGNTFIGVALTSTSGTDDQLVVVRLALFGS